MEQAGADLIELGIPFSLIQLQRARLYRTPISVRWKHGATVEGVFEMVESLRKKIKHTIGFSYLFKSRIPLWL